MEGQCIAALGRPRRRMTLPANRNLLEVPWCRHGTGIVDTPTRRDVRNWPAGEDPTNAK
jgi:hypothetical protein